MKEPKTKQNPPKLNLKQKPKTSAVHLIKNKETKLGCVFLLNSIKSLTAKHMYV